VGVSGQGGTQDFEVFRAEHLEATMNRRQRLRVFQQWLDAEAARRLLSLFTGGYFEVWGFHMDGTPWYDTIKNGVTYQGLNDIISVYLAAGTQKLAWFLGLIDNSGFSGLNPNDTLTSHSGWTESTAYNESNRPTWTPGPVAGQAVTNPTPATFTMSTSSSIYGMFLASNNTKGGTSGVLWATGGFQSGVQTLPLGQPLKATYNLAAAGA
jgi:hypothetical protein